MVWFLEVLPTEPSSSSRRPAHYLNAHCKESHAPPSVHHQCKYRYVFRPSQQFLQFGIINHFLVFTGKQGKPTQENSSSSAARMKRLSSGSGVAKIQSSLLFYVSLSKLSGKALLEFKYRHIVGLVGLCNRILHTMVYRLLLFYIGNALCIFNCPEGSGIPRYITACSRIQL